MAKLKILKVRDVKTPTRGTDKSAGLDFYVPNDFDGDGFIMPHGSILIPSGIKVKVPEGYMLAAFNKSGVSTKMKLIVGACIVDEDYQGEIHIHLINTYHNVVRIQPGMKLVQFILVPVLYADVEECDSAEDLYPQISERGAGAFGSTDKK